ncbi:MAG: M48 family metallopeptidase [Elusimicrobiota bacterium]|jgi:STE24 endopeptidase|nr:M48 family metallopeptidase [Elusimicrobiota bacterium]
MSISTFFVIFVLFSTYLVKQIADFLNLKSMTNDIPEEFNALFDKEKYAKAQKYLKINTKFSIVYSTSFLAFTIILILSGAFKCINDLSMRFVSDNLLLYTGYLTSALIFAAIVFGLFGLLKIPFSFYRVFYIEEKFGFNKMTVKVFVFDLIKTCILSIIIGAIIFGAIVSAFYFLGELAWLYAFAAIALFEIFIIFIAPVVIMPLFNKYTPLEDGELKSSIEQYAQKENFKMKGLFKMDGSKRSTKSNAFFTGFGKFRRIVLFDTLIKNHTVDELTSVLAHEMGHFKLNHIKKNMLFSFISMGFMFYIMSLFLNQEWLYNAFLMPQNHHIYNGIIFFGFLYTPISFILSVISNCFSRKHENEADAYAAKTYGKPESLINALKKLSCDNLSNLTPHKFKIFLEYSHPPVLERIKSLKFINREITKTQKPEK